MNIQITDVSKQNDVNVVHIDRETLLTIQQNLKDYHQELHSFSTRMGEAMAQEAEELSALVQPARVAFYEFHRKVENWIGGSYTKSTTKKWLWFTYSTTVELLRERMECNEENRKLLSEKFPLPDEVVAFRNAKRKFLQKYGVSGSLSDFDPILRYYNSAWWIYLEKQRPCYRIPMYSNDNPCYPVEINTVADLLATKADKYSISTSLSKWGESKVGTLRKPHYLKQLDGELENE